MARLGLFNRHTEEQDRPTGVGSASATDRTVVDRDRDGVDDRVENRVEPRDTNRDDIVTPDEARAAHERTQARLANRERLAAEKADRDTGSTTVTDRPAVADRDRVVERERVVERPVVADRPAVDRDRDGVDDRVQARPAPQPKIRARASLFATLALMVGLTSVYAALSGRLAPVAVALGVLGLLLSFAGLSASGRPRVAGGGLSVFALLLSVGGAVLGVLAMNDTATWLNSDVDQVSRLRDWLDSQLPFMSDW